MTAGPALAVIGGTGAPLPEGWQSASRPRPETPYGAASGVLAVGVIEGRNVVFISRHGDGSRIPPHRVNYRANLRALREVGAGRVLGVNAVGAIHPALAPGSVVIPHQLIDYTVGRDATFADHDSVDDSAHIDFTEPYSRDLREHLQSAAAAAGIAVTARAIYGVTQGPRLETAAEIDRLERDGCDVVGMTGMPEAALARELGMDYASCAVVANWAAGRGDGALDMARIRADLEQGMRRVRRLVQALLTRL